MKKNLSKRSLVDEELKQIDLNNDLINNINDIISKAEALQTKFINIREPMEGEFSHALEELDLGEELRSRLNNNANYQRELLSNPEWVRHEKEKLDSANELMTLIPNMDGDSESAEMMHQASIINNSNLTNAIEAVQDFEQIESENQVNSRDVTEREYALRAIDEYVDRLQNIKLSLYYTLNNRPSPMSYSEPLSTFQFNRVKSANSLANKDNIDQGTYFEPIQLSEIRNFENDYREKVLTPIQRSQSAPPTSQPSKSQKKGGKTIKRNKNKYKNTRRIKYNAKRGTRRNYKKSKKSSKPKRTIRRRYK